MGLTREEILAGISKRRQKVEPLDMEEWGGTVFIRLLSAAELKEAGYFDGTDPAALPINLMTACLSDEQGHRLFAKEDLTALAESDFPTTVKVFEKAAKVCGLTDSDVEKAAAAFVEAQPGDSSSS